MRVLHVVNVRWWNASAAYAVAAARATRAIGHETLLVADEDSPVAGEARAARLDVREIPRLDRVRARTALAGLAELADVLRTWRPDCVVAHRPESHAWTALARPAAGLETCAVVAARTDARPPRRSLFARRLFRQATDLVLVPAAYTIADHLAPLGVDDRRIRVLPFPIDTTAFAPGDRGAARAALGWRPDERVACIVARLSRVKGHAVLLDAFARVLRERADARLVVSGAEDDVPRADLREQAERLGIAARVTLLDRADDPRTLFWGADLGVVASVDSEAICRVAEEWMACGRALVGTRVHAVSEAIAHEETGLLVPPHDAGALSGALARLLHDDAARARMERAARARAESVFGERAFAAHLEEALATAIAIRRGAVPVRA